MTTERRRHFRLSVEVKVDLASRDNFFAGKTRDLSLGGLFVESEHDVEIGSEVLVYLELDGWRHAIRCEVVWTLRDDRGATHGVGLRFLALNAVERHAIQRFMAKRAPLLVELDPDDGDPSSVSP